ncbi:hypothetical protein DY000_02014893 [Brassica cretica]|uniref:Uncharacterized protein n=1 Tax=Brassica cretica TaxID=69181 RepID=A0ABQ7CQW3_BRACR|nr:hypothetical protein DY000_02014893 [Brassica cretica]
MLRGSERRQRIWTETSTADLDGDVDGRSGRRRRRRIWTETSTEGLDGDVDGGSGRQWIWTTAQKR